MSLISLHTKMRDNADNIGANWDLALHFLQL